MRNTIRRFKTHVRDGIKDLRTAPHGVESSAADNEAPSKHVSTDSQKVATKSIEQDGTDPLVIRNADAPGWDPDIWQEAYNKVKTDPKDATLMARLEAFLEKPEGSAAIEDDDEPVAADSIARLKTIQKIAEQKLEIFEDAKLSFNIGNTPIIVRESIIKAVEVINALKPIVSGAVAAEPAAALAWAGISTALPILERVFQQDENAATGLAEITFLLARYQMFHEPDFTSNLQSTSHAAGSQELLDRIRDELVSVYAAIYIYQAHFILQYASRSKMHRTFRNALNADEWKKLWSEIQSKSRRIDEGVRDQVGAQTLEIWKKVESIQMSTARIESIQQDTLKAVLNIDQRQLLQSLKITGNATFDSRQTSTVEAPCLPGTQIQMLKTIQEWADDPAGEVIFWLEGMAGTGKTSISMTVASALKEGEAFTKGLDPPNNAFLGASFFFKQGDTTRNNTVEFFTTIAWCLSGIFPEPESPITKAIRDNPGMETKSPQQQFRTLIADPLTLIDKKAFLPFQILVVVDALDECDDKDAETLLGMLGILEGLHQVRLRLFITSRREGHISLSFKGLPSRFCRTARLEKVDKSSGEDNDITFYLKKTLEGISKKYQVKDGGVSNSEIKMLSEKADGLFIYAVTACRFLGGPHFANKRSRDTRLALIFEEEGPQQEVDGIYLKVLKFPDFEGSHERLRVPFYSDIGRLIGFMVVLLQPASVETLCHLLPTTNEDLDYLLGYLHPIFNVPDDPGVPISLIHLSFRDFILNENRSESLPFSIDELMMHRDIFDRCLDLMNSDLCYNICDLELPGTYVSEIEPSQIAAHIPQYLRYVCLYWVKHLSKMDCESLAQLGLEDNGIVHIFLQEKLLYWLEVFAFIGEASSIIPIINQLETLINSTENPDLWSLLHDAKRFIQSNMWIIEHAPLQMYCSGLLFCPSRSRMRFYYEHLIPEYIKTRPQTPENWSTEQVTLHGHSGRIHQVRFSPTESLLASVSDDNTTRVWDYLTGSEKYLFQDPGGPRCVSFSADGLSVASGSRDGTVCVRDLKKATEISFSYLSEVEDMSFSPTDSNILAAFCQDSTLHVWNLDKKEDEFQHTTIPSYRRGFVFSPDGEFIAVCQVHRITLYSVTLREQVSQFYVLEEAVTMAFSIDSRIIAVRQYDRIEFWDITSSNPTMIKSYEAGLNHNLFLYLPLDGTLKLHQDSSGTIELFEASTGVSMGRFLHIFGQSSHDGALFAFISIYHPVIKIISDPSATSLRGNELSAPSFVGFLFDDNIALSCATQMVSKRWNVVDGCAEPLQDHAWCVTLSPDGKFVCLQLREFDKFQVWNKTMTHLIATFEQMTACAFMPRTNHLVTLSLLGELEFLEWDTDGCNFKSTESFKLHDVIFKAAAASPPWIRLSLCLPPSGEEAIVDVLVSPNAFSDDYTRAQSFQLFNLGRKTKVVVTCVPIYSIILSPKRDFFGIDYNSFGDLVRLFHMSSGEEVDDCGLCGYKSLTFHPIDHIFAVASKNDKTVAIWGGLPWGEKFVLEAPQGQKIRDFTFSATSRLAVLSSSHETRTSTIEIWDVATGQKIGSQVLALYGHVESFCFSADENFLESNRGRLPVPIQHTVKGSMDNQWEGLHNCLYVLNEWIFQGRERLIWLPSTYRPPVNWTKNVDVRGGTIALAHKDNSVVFIGVSLEKTPVAKMYMGLNPDRD